MTEEKRLPFYIVLDMSESMGRNTFNETTRIETAFSVVEKLKGSLNENTVAKNAILTRVIGFNEETIQLMTLDKNKGIYDGSYKKLEEWISKVDKESCIYKKCEGQTYYSVLFRDLAEFIKKDKKYLIKCGYTLYRPIVYFLTDGKPEGKSETQEKIDKEFEHLMSTMDDKSQEDKAPEIVCIGIGEADKGVLEKYAASRITNYCKEEKKDIILETGDFVVSNKKTVFIVKNEDLHFLEVVNEAIIKAVINSVGGGTIEEAIEDAIKNIDKESPKGPQKRKISQ